jgi:hypothetical protein
MPIQTKYRNVFNGSTIVRRKLVKQKGGKVMPKIIQEREIHSRREAAVSLPKVDKAALPVKLSADLFKSL